MPQTVANLLINEIRPKLSTPDDVAKYFSPEIVALMARALLNGTRSMHQIREVISDRIHEEQSTAADLIDIAYLTPHA